MPGATLGAAVCQELAAPLAPGEARRLVFSITWDAHAARFGSGRALPRRYTRYFGRGGRPILWHGGALTYARGLEFPARRLRRQGP